MSQPDLDAYAQTLAKGQQVHSSMSWAVQQDPDAYAKTLALAAKTGTAPAFAQDPGVQPTLQQGLALQGVQDLAFSHPKTSQWLSDPNQAAVSHDDLPALKTLEDVSQNRPQGLTDSQWAAVRQSRLEVAMHNAATSAPVAYAQSAVGGFSRMMSGFFLKTLPAVAEAAASVPVELGYWATGPQSLNQTMENIRTAWNLSPQTDPNAGLGGVVSRYADSMDQAGARQERIGAPKTLVDPVTGQVFDNPDYFTFGKSAVGRVAADVFNRQTANQLLGAPGIMAASVANPEAVATMMTSNAGAESYARARQQGAGFLPALEEGAGNAALNWALFNKVPQAVEPQTMLGKALQPAGRAVALGGGMTAGENLLARLHDPNRPLTEGAASNMATFLGYEYGGALPRLAEAAGQSKLRARSPEAFQAAASQILDGTPHEEVSVPADRLMAFYQDHNLDPKTIQALGVKNLQEALESGTDAQIPTANLLTHLDPKLVDELAQDVRSRPGELTPRERADWFANGGPEQLQQAAQGTDLEATPDQPSEAWQAVKDEMAGRYREGGASESESEALATKDANVFSNLGRGAGLDPREVLALVRPQVVLGEAPVSAPDRVPDMEEGFHAPTEPPDFFSQHPELDPLLWQGGKPNLNTGGSDEGQPDAGGGSRAPGAGPEDHAAGPGAGEGRPQPSVEMVLRALDRATREGIPHLGFGADHGSLKGLPAQETHSFEGPRTGEKLWLRTFENGKPDQTDILLKSDRPGATGEQAHLSGTIKGNTFFVGTMHGEGLKGIGRDLYQTLGTYLRKNHPEVKWVVGQAGGTVDNPEGIKLLRNDFAGTHWSGDWAGTPVESLARGPRGAEFRGQPSDPLYQPPRDPGRLSSKMSRLGSSTRAGMDKAMAENHLSEEAAFESFNKGVEDLQARDMQDQARDARGWFRMREDGSWEIGKTKVGDLSTFIHEPAHGYLFLLGDLASREGASETIKDDAAKVLKFLGADSFDTLTRDQHEQWARANEAYLREGKAPSPGLRDVFRRFSVWLSGIYRKASDLGVELSPEIRDVFDRMYASEEGVNRAEQDLGPKLFNSPEEAGWSEEKFQRYADKRNLSLDEAKQEVLAKLNEAALREKSADWAEEMRGVRQAVAEQLDGTREYQAIRALRKGVMEDGTPITLNREELARTVGEDQVKALYEQHPKLYRREGGMDSQAAAELLGYGSGQEMVDALLATPKRADAIEEGARRFMIEKHGDIRFDGSLEDQARRAVLNDERAQSLHQELMALRKKVGDGGKPAKSEAQRQDGGEDAAWLAKQANALADTNQKLRGKVEDLQAQRQANRQVAEQVAPLEAYRAEAQKIIEQKAPADLNPHVYLEGMRRYSRESLDKLGKNKPEEALAAKHRELLNHFLYREAVKARADVEDLGQRAEKLQMKSEQQRLGKAGAGFLDQTNNLLARYGLGKAPFKPTGESLSDWAEKRFQDGIQIDPTLLNEHRTIDWKKAPIQELRSLRDALKNIRTVARNELTFLRDGFRVSFDTEIQRFNESVQAKVKQKPVPRKGADTSLGERVVSKLNSYDAYANKLLWWVGHLDGDDVTGPAHQNIYQPISDAHGRFLEMGNQVLGQLKEAFDARPAEDVRALNDLTSVQFPGDDRPLTRTQLMSWALNLGTEENLKVALLGEGLVNGDGTMHPAYDQAMKTLKASEWEFIQKVWDILGQMREPVAEKERRVTGIEPKWKQTRDFTVDTADGKTLTLRGNYYPLKADSSQSEVGRVQEDPAQLVKPRMQPVTSRSHVQDVTGATYKLALDFPSVLSDHLSKVIKDVTSGEAIAQVHKFLSDPRVYQRLQESLGDEVAKEFPTWLLDFARNGRGNPADQGPVVRNLMRFKTGMVVAKLGGNISSLAVQGLDLLRPMVDADFKTRYLAQSYLDLARNSKEILADIREKSPNVMRFREENWNRDLKDMAEAHEKTVAGQKLQQAEMFVMQAFTAVDRRISFPLWLARFRQGMDTHGDEARAIQEADRIVERDLQSGQITSMSRLMRDQGGMRLLTAWLGDAQTWYGILASALRSQNTARISMALMGALANTALGAWLHGDKPKELKEAPEWAINQILLTGFDKVPVLGDAAKFGLDRLEGNRGNFSTPVLSALEKSLRESTSLADYARGANIDLETAIMNTADAGGTFLGVPGTSQAIKAWRYVHAVKTGKERPENVVDFTAGLVHGPTPKGKK